MNFPRRAPREPVARRLCEPPSAFHARTVMDPPTSDTSSSGSPTISLSSSQLAIKAQRQQKQQQSTQHPNVPRDPSVVLIGPRQRRLELDPESTRLSNSSDEQQHPRLATPIRTRNPVSRDSSSGVRTTEIPNFSRILEKASSAVSNQSNSSSIVDARNMGRSSRQVGSSTNSSSNSMRLTDRIPMASRLQERLRRRKDDIAKPAPSAKPTALSPSRIPILKRDERPKSRAEEQRYAVPGSHKSQGQVMDDETIETAQIVRASSIMSSTTSSPRGTDAFNRHDEVAKHTATDSVTVASDASEEEVDGYSEFIEILQAEVSGQHSQLWSSFKAVLSGETPPTPTVVRPSKVFKFDSKTKSALNAMNLHLKEHAPVECLHATQVVNDKNLGKEIAAQLPSLATSSSLEESCDPISQSRSSYSIVESGASHYEENDEAEIDDGLHAARTNEDVDKIMTMRTISKDDSTAHSEHSNSHEPAVYTRTFTNDHWNNNLSQSRTDGAMDAIVTMRSVSGDDESEHKLYGHRKLDLTATLTCSTDAEFEEEKKADDHPYARILPSPAGTAAFGEDDSNPGLEVTLGQFNSKYPMNALKQSVLASNGSVTWSDIKLKPSHSSNKTPGAVSDTSDELPPPEWASLKLRHVQQYEESDDATMRYVDSEDSPTSLEQPSGTTPSSTALTTIFASSAGSSSNAHSMAMRMNFESSSDTSHFEKSSSSHEFQPAASLSSETSSPICPNDNDRVEQARSFVDEDAKDILSKQDPNDCSLENKVANAKVFKLKDTPGLKNNCVAHVTVGSQLLMVAQSEPNNPTTRVLWKLSRSDVKTFSLDMSSLTVDVTLRSDAHKWLTFTSSDDCLKFANVFHSMKCNEVAHNEPNIDTFESNESLHDESIHVESLNDEEHIVLETYRRLRRTKDVNDALNESIKLDSASERSQSACNVLLTGSSALTLDKHSNESDTVASAFVPMADQPPSVVDAATHPSSPVSAISGSVGSAAKAFIRGNLKSLLEAKLGAKAATVSTKATGSKVDAVLGDIEGEATSKLTDKEEALVTKYRKMLQMGIEYDRVEHCMTKESAADKVRAIVNASEEAKKSRTTDDHAHSDPCASANGAKSLSKSVLSDEDESLASNYRRLLKIQIPKDEVYKKMRHERASEEVMVAVVGRAFYNSQSSINSKVSSKDATSQSSKLVSLHWNVLSGKELDQSVWKAANITADEEESLPERHDISKLIDLFQKKTAVVSNKPSQGTEEKGKANLLDLTRSNNIAISLKAFKDIPSRELADILANLDPLRRIRGDKVQFLRGLLPTIAEIALVRAYDGPDSNLTPAERWFRHIQSIERIEQKVKVLQTMESFEQESKTRTGNFNLLSTVCKQVMGSEKLQEVLGMVLRIGNFMNEGTKAGRAAGFKMDSLLKLTETKSKDNKITVLDFLVEVFVENGQRQTLDLTSDFPECHTASRMAIGDLIAETQNLKDSLQLCQVELDALKGTSHKGGPNQLRNDMGSIAAMVAAIARGKSEEAAPEIDTKQKSDGFAQREQFLESIKSKESKHSSEENSSIDHTTDSGLNSIEGGIARLEQFLKAGNVAFRELDAVKKQALDNCKALSRYCGEGFQTGPTTTLLGILASFTTILSRALAKYDEREAMKSRNERRRANETSSLSSSKSRGSLSAKNPKEGGASLIVLVNNMLKNASERTIEDFKKGRMIPDPSSHMKAIYEREKLISSSASNSVGSVGTLASDNKVSTLATMDKNACNEDSRTHVVLETPEPPQSYDPENVPSSGVQHARALFENLILRSPTKPIASHSPMKATVVKHTDKLPHFNSSSETHNSAKAHEAECQSMPTESVPINAANAETMPGVECTFKKEALLSPEGQSSLIHVIETACNNLVKEKEDLVEPPDCFTTDEPSLTTIPSAPDAGVKPVGSPMLLSEARRARMSMEKAANRPHKSALLPLVSARRLSGSVHDLEIANLVVPTLSSAEKLPTVDAAVEEVGNINASHVENKCLQQPISLPTTPVRIERKSIGEMARERRANKHSSTSAAILPEPAVEECTDDSKAMIPGHEMELLNAGSHDAAATPPKGHLLELAYLKRENRRVSLGTEDAS